MFAVYKNGGYKTSAMGVNHNPSRYLVSWVHKEKSQKAKPHALSSQLEAVKLSFGSSPRKLKGKGE